MTDSTKPRLNWSSLRSETLVQRLREKGVAIPESNPIRRRDASTPFAPLSLSQLQLWTFDQLMPGTPVYNLPSAIRINGDIDLASLETAISEIVRRHESLRTSFKVIEDEPVQVISPVTAISVPLADLICLPAEARERKAQQQMMSEAQRPFDLTKGPLLRVGLLRLKSNEHILLLTMHHIVSDGWSFELFIQEVTILYNTIRSGNPVGLPDLPIQYADYALWQRQWMQGELLETHLAYWKRQLAGALPILELPLDRARPAEQSFRKEQQWASIPADLTQDLIMLSRREGVTQYMTLLAAFGALLYHHTGQTDICIGAPIARRTRAETENLIGLFANTTLLRINISESSDFQELLRHVREVCAEAFSRQEIPFEKLVEILRPLRDLSHAPLTQVIFNLLNHNSVAVKQKSVVGGLNVNYLPTINPSTQFDLNLAILETPQGLITNFEYNPDIFEAMTINLISQRYQILLRSIVADSKKPLHNLQILADADRAQILTEWNQTERLYPPLDCVHFMIEEQVERTPDAVALGYEDLHLSYSELNNTANRIARFLLARQVAPESIVAILFERGPELVIALLAVLKAGAAYLPLDPATPQKRLKTILEDSGAKILLSDVTLASYVEEYSGEGVVVGSGLDLSDYSCENIRNGVCGNNLAYVIYTSGSTGQPKGVSIPHRGITNRLRWMQEEYCLTDMDHVLQKTPATFDVSVWEFLWPLMSGAQLIVARPGGQRDLAYLVDVIQQRQITVLHFVPAMLKAFLDEAGVARCQSVRFVFSSGEALGWVEKENFFTRLKGELHNLYGPTEASIDVTRWACLRGNEDKIVPIGRPIANTQVYVLDKRLEPSPVGVKGELFIGGIGLARGYLRQPNMTAEKFLPHPHDLSPGGRLYRSGDQTRYLPGGQIEYLGRLDEQIKVRGYRIELDEIENVLSQHTAIRQAVIAARRWEQTGEQRLVAYMTPAKSHTPSTSELRRYLKEQLPDYMIPSAFVWIEEIPLTPNGKLNRRALPEPVSRLVEKDYVYVAPRTSLESELARIWADLLGVERVGVHDNFFELGGHSLLLTQLASRIRNILRVEVPLRVLFDVPTIDEMTVAIAKTQLKQEDKSEISDMLEELKRLSPEEVNALLESEGQVIFPITSGRQEI